MVYNNGLLSNDQFNRNDNIGQGLYEPIFNKQTDLSTELSVLSTRGSTRGENDDDTYTTATLIIPSSGGPPTFVYGNFSSTDTVDWYKFYATKGDSYGNDADRFNIDLSDIATNGGVYMELYAPLPHPHKLGRSMVHDRNDVNSSANFNMIAPLNGTYYIKVMPAAMPSGTNETYIINCGKVVWSENAAYDGDNSFTAPKRKFINSTKTFQETHFLSSIHDVHDFYYFNGYENQTLKIELKPQSNDADYDIYLFRSQTTKYNSNDASEGWGTGSTTGKETINAKLTIDKEYYIRVAAKINNTNFDDNDKNYGNYNLRVTGNIPPRWKNGVQEAFYLTEDDPPFFIEPEEIWYDLNPNDDLFYLVWNVTTQSWHPRNEKERIKSQVDYDNFRVEIINNGTPFFPDEVIKITPFKNKFGVTEVKLGVRDYPASTENDHNITIYINPKNDPPVINNAISWKDNVGTASFDDDKVTVAEFNNAEIEIDAYDIDGDNLTFTAVFDDPTADFASAFNVEKDTGLITFYADYTYIGKYGVTINATDDGIHPNSLSTTRKVVFEIVSSTIDRTPKTKLLNPSNGSTLRSTIPILTWNITDLDTDPILISYSIYLSTNRDEVVSYSEDAKVAVIKNQTQFEPDTALLDSTIYYWAVVPYDGIFTGKCLDDWFKFKIDTSIVAPEAMLLAPANNIILNNVDVELKWEIEYTGEETVLTSDVYIGVNKEELKWLDNLESTNYKPENIFNGNRYYWQIVPKAGTGNNIIEGEESPIWSFEIEKEYEPPVVTLIEPRDRAILKNNDIVLKWDVDFDNPNKVEYKIFLSTSEKFDFTPYKTLLGTQYLAISDLEERRFYWKILPYIGKIPGNESEVWTFKIDSKVVQPVVVPISPKDDEIINVYGTELKWTLNYDGPKAKVRYDVYLDNSTSDPARMRAYSMNYAQFFIFAELSNQKIYHWRVIPTIEIDEGFIVGSFKNNVSKFKVDWSYLPPPEPKLNLTLFPNYLSLHPGEEKTIKIKLNNTGNVMLMVNLSYEAEPADGLIISLSDIRVSIEQDEFIEKDLIIIVPKNIEQSVVIITIEGLVEDMNLNERDILNIEIKPEKEEDKSQSEKSSSNMLLFIIPLIVVILVLIFLTIIITKQRKRKKEEKKAKEKEEKETEPKTAKPAGQLHVPSVSPYSIPSPVATSYKPAQPISPVTPTATAVPVQGAQGAQGAQSKVGAAAAKVKPITPVPAKLVSKTTQPAKPVTPIKATAVKVEPVKAETIKTQAVKALPATKTAKPAVATAKAAVAAKKVDKDTKLGQPVKAVPAKAVPAKPKKETD